MIDYFKAESEALKTALKLIFSQIYPTVKLSQKWYNTHEQSNECLISADGWRNSHYDPTIFWLVDISINVQSLQFLEFTKPKNDRLNRSVLHNLLA